MRSLIDRYITSTHKNTLLSLIMMIRSVAVSSLSRRLVSLSVQGGRHPLTRSSSVATFRLKNDIFSSLQPSLSRSTGTIRWYTPMTKEEEEKEKARASHIPPEQKEQELRELNRELARLEMLRGINTGELYTWSGRYKGLMRDYAFPLFAYYWVIWTCCGVGMYLAIDVGGVDTMQVLGKIDNYWGWNLSEKVDPQLGKIGMALVMNEMVEPLRLPFVVATLKPAMEFISPSKY